MLVTQSAPGTGTEEKLRVLDEVLRSETFARSERLKSLLRFLCEAEIEGREAGLTEYNIGTMALGKPADFSPLEDSSVRSRAHELRQKLEKYYTYEAPAAPIHIELRKGAYIPRFLPVNSTAHPSIQAAGDERESVPPAAPSTAQAHPLRLASIAFAAGAAAMFALLALWSAATKPGVRLPATRLETSAVPSLWTPELESIWAPFIGARKPLLIAFETRFFVRMGPLVVRDWHVNNIGAVETSEPLMRTQRLFGLHQLYPSGNYADVGAPVALFYLSRLLSSRVPLMSVRSSREMTAPDLRDNNLILVGKPWMDPRIERILAAAGLVDANGRILNVRPGPGEPAEYKDVNDHTDPEGWSEKYAVITLMPSPLGPNRILALTGSGSEDPAALAWYMTDPEAARNLFRKLHVAGSSAAPEFYQILVKADFKAKTLVKAEYVTHRALKLPVPETH